MIPFLAAGRQMAARSSTSTARRLDNSTLRVLSIEGRQVTTLSDIPANGNRPAISPDGRWLAFGVPPSEASGRPAIYVRPFPGPGPSRQFVDAAGQPVWSRDGEKIFFRSQTRRAVGVFRRRDLRNAFRSLAWDRGRPGTAIVPESVCRRRVHGRRRLRRRARRSIPAGHPRRVGIPTDLTCTCCFTSTTSSDGAYGSRS